MVSFEAQKISILNLFFFLGVICHSAFEVPYLRKHCLIQDHKDLLYISLQEFYSFLSLI